MDRFWNLRQRAKKRLSRAFGVFCAVFDSATTRATLCASSVRADIMSQCEFDSTYVSDVGLDATFPETITETANRVTVDALVNGCCAAVAAHADAGCACALEVAEGLAPFFFAGARQASARAPSAMARSDAVHAAVATLEALCFGGKGDAPNLEYDAYDAAKKKPTSCVASSATLAATRAVALEGVPPQDRSEPGTTSGGSTHIAASAFASSSSPSPGTSPEEKEYAAFLRWLDGGANSAADTSAGFERTSSGSDDLARDRGSASLGDRVTNATNATTKTNVTKGGQRKTKTIPSSRVAGAALVVVAALLAAAALALVAVTVRRCVIAERARRRREGLRGCRRAPGFMTQPPGWLEEQRAEQAVRVGLRRGRGRERPRPWNRQGLAQRVCGPALGVVPPVKPGGLHVVLLRDPLPRQRSRYRFFRDGRAWWRGRAVHRGTTEVRGGANDARGGSRRRSATTFGSARPGVKCRAGG